MVGHTNGLSRFLPISFKTLLWVVLTIYGRTLKVVFICWAERAVFSFGAGRSLGWGTSVENELVSVHEGLNGQVWFAARDKIFKRTSPTRFTLFYDINPGNDGDDPVIEMTPDGRFLTRNWLIHPDGTTDQFNPFTIRKWYPIENGSFWGDAWFGQGQVEFVASPKLVQAEPSCGDGIMHSAEACEPFVNGLNFCSPGCERLSAEFCSESCSSQAVRDWSQQELRSPEQTAHEGFGKSVASDGVWAAVGTTQGTIHIYKRTPEGLWLYHQTLTGNLSHQNENFADVMDMEDGVLAVSSKNYNGADTGTGAVYVFELGAGEIWQRRQILESDFPQQWSIFGEDVAIDGGRILTGVTLQRRQR